MKILRPLFILLIIIIPLFILPSVVIAVSYNKTNFTEIVFTSESGVSNYEITQSVTYQVEINFTLTHISGIIRDYFFKFSRLNDRQPNSTLTQFNGPYQESVL